jgi:hypothetical protein
LCNTLFCGNLEQYHMDKQTISAVMREMGRKGGKIGGPIGGKRSLETMTPAERTARAKKAAAASAKVRRAKKG